MDRLGTWTMVLLAVLAVAAAAIFGWQRFVDAPVPASHVAALTRPAAETPEGAPQRPSAPQVGRVSSQAPSQSSVQEPQAGGAAVGGDDGQASTAPATVESGQTGQTGAEATSGTAASTPAGSGGQLPVFDLVQVDENGHVVLAGRAQPGATVVVLVDGQVIGFTSADAQGAWAFDTDDEPPLRDTHQLTIRIEDEDGNVLARARQTVLISMKPAKAGGPPLVVLSSPDAPSRVLQKPAMPRLADTGGDVRNGSAVPENADAAPVATAGETASAAADNMAARQEQVEREGIAARRAGSEQLASAARSFFERKSAPREAAGGGASFSGEASAVVDSRAPALLVEVVDYDSDGAIFFTGRSGAGAALRLYVNNRHLGDVQADAEGRWQWSGRASIAPGKHILRVDALAADGRVLQRMELPFVRADVQQLARAGKAEREAGTVAGGATATANETDNVDARIASLDADATETGAAMPGIDVAARPVSRADGTTEDRQAQQAAAGGKQEGARGFIVVQPGNNLWNIARVIYGKGVRYTTIYEANRDRIRDPDRIYPGQVFAAPGLPARQLSIDPRRRRPATAEELQQAETLR